MGREVHRGIYSSRYPRYMYMYVVDLNMIVFDV